MAISLIPGVHAGDCKDGSDGKGEVREVSQHGWVVVGIILGAAAGVLGAYAGWRQAAGPAGTRPPRWIAALTLVLGLGLGAVALSMSVGHLQRALLLLPSATLGLWFVFQVRAIREAGKDESHSCGADCGKGCHRK